MPLATGGVEKLRGDDFKQEFKAQRGDIHRRGVHVAYGLMLAWCIRIIKTLLYGNTVIGSSRIYITEGSTWVI